ncbi:RluA family pseudouridine synthase [Segnochrobactrum spirostomi]|uniref:RluA family pseudouridine synthase n=1 Tax=Segnochrobactrum spirostomi TaxID=2608987 RepID=A0A6A7XY07_9HYPH|nr:RluA family pseudouridine synthase [Segnochrobactrum spirostomi]MQT11305.1 RluA family pseudouridine synthase [Segnochrobactrum spirostomi]
MANDAGKRSGNGAEDGPDPLGLRPRVLYRDDAVIVLDKPAGIAVHKGPKGGIVLEDGFDALRFGQAQPPQLAHRLDKDTSGCLVLGRTGEAIAALGRLFAAKGRVEKHYWAVVQGGPTADEGTIDAPLRKRDAARGWWMVVDHANGQPSSTIWRVLGRGAGFAWLDMIPVTGRTHQLRIHAAHAGFPILGDPIYGQAARSGAHLHLHARGIAFTLGHQRVDVTAPVPDHMRAGLGLCGWRPEAG